MLRHQWRRNSIGNLGCIFELFESQTELKFALVHLSWLQTWTVQALTDLRHLSTCLISVKGVWAERCQVSFYLYSVFKLKNNHFFFTLAATDLQWIYGVHRVNSDNRALESVPEIGVKMVWVARSKATNPSEHLLNTEKHVAEERETPLEQTFPSETVNRQLPSNTCQGETSIMVGWCR